MKKIILGTAFIALLASCSTYKTVQNNTQTVAVAIDLNTVVDDKIMVEINPQKIKEKTLIYNIPAIVPGTYAMSNYGKFVAEFKAFDYDGKELVTTKLNENSWQINNAKNMDKISYWVEDTFDSEKEHKIYVMAGTNIEEGKNFLLNLPGFIGYFNNKKELPYEITVTHPTNLYETSSLINKNTTKTDNSKDVFLAPRYDEISDNPIMYAPLNNVNFTVNGIDVNLAVYSPNNKHKATDLEEALKTMMTAQTNFLKGFETTNEYNVLVYLFDPEVYKFQGYGALEHRSSTTVVYPETMSKKQFASNMINGTVSHEFFHIVSPLSVHSEEIHTFDFNKANMSEHLWMYEGMTEYFANLFQVNQGLISEGEFINEMNVKIGSSMRYNDAMSFTKMSKNILEPEYAKNYGNVYQKGALIGMVLDIILREESNGTYGVRNMMLDLSKKYGKNNAFKDEKIIDEIVKMTYPSVGEFFKNHVQGATPINYETYFKKVGVKKETKTENATYFIDSKGQPFISVNEAQKVFFTKRTNSALVSLGVKTNDVLEAVNGEKISLANIRPVIGKTMLWKAGDIITIEVTRNGKLVTLKGNYVQPTSQSTALVIENLPVNNTKVILRKAWLKN
ncbi:peptidase M61 [Tenacibaculum soleae]|uniref:M61 family metallopeptidase n=1 Tax=Tenacibaculum soleae TaxID=447689 RepID=UPI0026E2A06E|nr:peptidase M61 [Tenacibaculum soleae]MDO6745058.1 peptidase M61 [Tenacibaculum soleae]